MSGKGRITIAQLILKELNEAMLRVADILGQDEGLSEETARAIPMELFMAENVMRDAFCRWAGLEQRPPVMMREEQDDDTKSAAG